MMGNKFDETDIKRINELFSGYKHVNDEIERNRQLSKDIHEKLKELDIEIGKLHKEEQDLMDELHKRYGDFTLQDIHNILDYDR